MNDDGNFTPFTELDNLDDKKLEFYHRVLHLYFKINLADSKKPSGWSQKEIMVVHSRIVSILSERLVKHINSDILDEVTCFKEPECKEITNNVYVSEEDLLDAIFQKQRSWV